MSETTPQREGLSSVIEGVPGGALALVLTWAASWTSHPMDAATAGAVVFLGVSASSFVIAWIREVRKRINAAADLIVLEHDGASSAEAVADVDSVSPGNPGSTQTNQGQNMSTFLERIEAEISLPFHAVKAIALKAAKAEIPALAKAAEPALVNGFIAEAAKIGITLDATSAATLLEAGAGLLASAL